jgi:ketosteroid isomerase-like protein
MSEENVEVVRRVLDLWNTFFRGDLRGEAFAEASVQVVDPQAEQIWRDERTIPGQPQHLRGLPEILRFWEQMAGAWVELVIEPLEFTEAPDQRVVTLCRNRARGRESGVPIVFHSRQVWTIREGRLRRLEFFRHRADALEAAGLSE